MTLLRMLSLDLLDKVSKRLDFHSTTILLLDFFDKDQTSLNITRLHSTHSSRWPNGSIFSSIFCRVKIRVKNRVVWPGPIMGDSKSCIDVIFTDQPNLFFKTGVHPRYTRSVTIILFMANSVYGISRHPLIVVEFGIMIAQMSLQSEKVFKCFVGAKASGL